MWLRARWVRQQTISPRAPVMQTWKNSAGVEMRGRDVRRHAGGRPATGPSWHRATDRRACRSEEHDGRKLSRRPALHIQSVAPVQFSAKDNVATVGTDTRVAASSRIEQCQAKSKTDCTLLLAPVTLAPGESQQVAFTIDRRCGDPTPAPTAAAACALRDAARRWWETSDLPFGTIQIPDAGIQAMIESCVRNIWQAREIKGGKPAFHVGPTVYRGLWIVDGSFLLESAAILNRAQDARAGIEYMLGHQKPDGSFEVLPKYWKENGIVLWAATRHAMLTQDKEWLRAHWPALQRVVKAIEKLRAALEGSRRP